MKINSGKRDIAFSGHDIISFNAKNNTVKSKDKSDLLGIILHTNLLWRSYKQPFPKNKSKVNAFRKIFSYMCLEKKGWVGGKQ